jgi:hypothetical protein
MAYSGSTAASSVANPPALVSGQLTRSSSLGPNLHGGSVWSYQSADGSTVTSASNYFTDAWYLGIRPGDHIMGSYSSSVGSTDRYSYRLIVTSVTTNGAVCSTAQMSTG